MSTAIQQIETAITNAQRIMVVTHISPDGDAIGSLTATGLALKQLGKEVDLVCDDGTLERFKYLGMSDKIQRRPDVKQGYDLVIVVDCGDAQRMGKAYGRLKAEPPIINIDHHISNTNFGAINLVDAQANSTTEILAYVFPQIGVEIDKSLANSLLTGLVTDTLCFRTSSVTAQTLQVAGQLVAAGANLAEITSQALILQPMTTVQMWRTGLNNMQVEDKVAWTTISNAEQRAISDGPVNSRGLGNKMADMYEVCMSAVFSEKEDGNVIVGFRSQPPFDVATLATELGGGGHRYASGCTVTGPLDAAVDRVITLAKEKIAQQLADPTLG